MNHPWDILADFIGRTIAERWAATRTNPPTTQLGAEPAPSSTDQNTGTTPGEEEHSPEKTNSRSKKTDVDP